MSLLRAQRRSIGRWMVRGSRRMLDCLRKQPDLPTPKTLPPRILLIRPYFLGDILLCLPLAQALRKARPDVQISWLLREEWREALEHHSVVDEVIPFSQEALRSFHAPREFLRIARELRQRNFGLVLTLAWDRISNLWAYASAAPIRIGIEEYGRPRFSSLTHHAAVITPNRTQDERPMTDFYFEPLRLLGFGHRTENPRVTPTQEERQSVVDRVGFKPFLLIHPGGRLSNKRWPPERFAELIRALREKTADSFVLICGPGEASWVCDLMMALPSGRGIFWPTPSLGELMALAERSRLFIGNDSGPMHLAAAAGSRCVVLFGTDSTRWRPAGIRHLILGGPGGMHQVRVKDVLKALDAILEK